MPRIKPEKRDRGFAKKRGRGCEANHKRHPAEGIPWCERCIKGGRCALPPVVPLPLVRMAEEVDRIISGA